MKYHIGEGVYVEVGNPFEIILTTEQTNIHGVNALTNVIVLKPEMLTAIETIYSREAADLTAKEFENAKKTDQGS